MEGTDIDMDSKFYEPEVLKQLQGEILSILDDFIRICEDYHLEYFGIAGTGIGALRHKGFIPGTTISILRCRGGILSACSGSWKRR